MKTIYLDLNFLCYLENAQGRTAVQTDVFDGCCDSLIEGYRYIPAGESWTNGDGTVFHGEMLSPAVSYESIRPKQEQYEEDLTNMMPLEDVAALIEIIYENDLGVIG